MEAVFELGQFREIAGSFLQLPACTCMRSSCTIRCGVPAEGMRITTRGHEGIDITKMRREGMEITQVERRDMEVTNIGQKLMNMIEMGRGGHW